MTGNILLLNQWRIEMSSGDIWPRSADDTTAPIERIEPKAVQLLALLAAHPQQLVDKQQILDTLWPRQTLTDDPLTRCVSRLRKALQDNPKQPKFIETLPRRGYRLIASDIAWQDQTANAETDLAPPFILPTKTATDVTTKRVSTVGILALLSLAVVLMLLWLNFDNDTPSQTETATALVKQADDYYLQMRRQDNEMAIELYQQAIALRPESGLGLAGLANTLVQQVIRWPHPPTTATPIAQNLRDALAEGRHQTAEAQQKLARALALAQQAVKLAPQHPGSHKALGFVYSASEQFKLAEQSYQRAIALDENAWDALINMGDILEIQGHLPKALPYYEQAFAAMGRVYDSQSARIQPWYADMGALVAEKHQQLGQPQQAESWYRHVLSFAPFNLRATRGLAVLLQQAGDADAAFRLCQEFQQRIGQNPCE
ncbi:MAG: winged helix-turn-helix domain-containing protein [Chromatiaceae bacterium]|nr:winged helix-turn-helix domain-containing protein [Chromatiaceae bacterium]